MYNTRIAPSPTGDFHIGTARTAYFNWLTARSTGGKFLLRIDDTDQKRNDPTYTQVILDSLKWLGLDYDDIVYQSNRFDIYRAYADLLKSRGWAKEDGGAIVLTDLKRGKGPTFWVDEIIGKVEITSNDIDDMDGMVLIKSDGSPAYNFCSIVDDMTLGINYIIRGVDHITNTSKQVILWNLLDPDVDDSHVLPKFAHVGLIALGNKPLSKRDGAASLLNYMKAGYDPDAMLNFLGRIGWGPNVDDKTTKMLPREKMLELFLTGGSMKAKQSALDQAKLESFDRKYKAKKAKP